MTCPNGSCGQFGSSPTSVGINAHGDEQVGSNLREGYSDDVFTKKKVVPFRSREFVSPKQILDVCVCFFFRWIFVTD